MQTFETCSTCRFFHTESNPQGGHCRRFPPIIVETVAFDGSGHNHFSQHWPWLSKDQWCGEHKRKPAYRSKACQPESL